MMSCFESLKYVSTSNYLFKISHWITREIKSNIKFTQFLPGVVSLTFVLLVHLCLSIRFGHLELAAKIMQVRGI